MASVPVDLPELISIGGPGRRIEPVSGTGRLRDSHGRAITDLRVSVTDRCNYRCVYCRTGQEGPQFSELPMATYLRMIERFVALGIEKVRLTGGEPLLRSGLIDMVAELSRMRTAWTAGRRTGFRGGTDSRSTLR